jgi:hypothetical protein
MKRGRKPKKYTVRSDIKEKLKKMLLVAELADGTRSVKEIAQELQFNDSVVCDYLMTMGYGSSVKQL